VWSQSLSVADLAIDELLSYTRNGKASKAVVEAVSTAATMKGRILDLSERIERLNSEAAEITNEQNRIRSNMNSIDRRSDLYERYMTKLNEQETRLEDIRELRQNVQLQLDAATNELRMFLNDLNVS
jgi:chromosome segregation ATPase